MVSATGPPVCRLKLPRKTSTSCLSPAHPETTHEPNDPPEPTISIWAVGTFLLSMLLVSAVGRKSKLRPSPLVVSGGPFCIIRPHNDGSEFSQYFFTRMI